MIYGIIYRDKAKYEQWQPKIMINEVQEMFRENVNHLQDSLFESTNWMNPRIKAKLDKSWAPIFYEHVFCKIDETTSP